MIKFVLTLGAGCLFASGIAANPVALNDDQLDRVTAGGAPSPTGFVCPVISTANVLHSPRAAGPLGDTGHYTIIGPEVAVPMHATNGNGTGVPGGPHSAPGDTDYTAIWFNQ